MKTLGRKTTNGARISLGRLDMAEPHAGSKSHVRHSDTWFRQPSQWARRPAYFSGFLGGRRQIADAALTTTGPPLIDS